MLNPTMTATVCLAALALPLAAQAKEDVDMLECVHDASVTQRFLPVELITGNPLPAEPVLQFTPVKRSYPFAWAAPGKKGTLDETSLEGPVMWKGAGGKEYEIYERKVPRAHERFALTADKTAVGRVYDERWGNATNEGKFPVGTWGQGQKRTYYMTYHTAGGDRQMTSAIEIEKLACSFDGVPGAVQFRWTTSRGLDYVYVLAPERGLVQVVMHRRGS